MNKCIQSVSQTCGYHLNMHTDWYSDMHTPHTNAYKVPHRNEDTIENVYEAPSSHENTKFKKIAMHQPDMRIQEANANKVPPRLQMTCHNALKVPPGHADTMCKCIQDAIQTCRYHVKMNRGCYLDFQIPRRSIQSSTQTCGYQRKCIRSATQTYG